MSLEQTIIDALRSRLARASGPLVDPGAGRQYQAGLQRTLGLPVTDRTDYRRDRAYVLEAVLAGGEHEQNDWRHILRVRISGAGPFVTHANLQAFGQGRWWTGTIRASRTGLNPEHTAALLRLRAWYAEAGLTEVDLETQALPAPAGLCPPGRAGEPVPTLFRALFIS